MHVLSIIHFPVFGGPHNRNARVAPLLGNKGIQTTVVIPEGWGNAADRLREAGVEVERLRLSRLRATKNPATHATYAWSFWGDVKRIRSLIRTKRIDLVQINGLANAQGAIAARLAGVPVVWQILDTTPPAAARRAMMMLVKRLADVVMCTGRTVASMHPGALDFRENLVLFFPPVDLETFVPPCELEKSLARQRLGIGPEAFVVGTVGNLNPQKGHATFVDAAARLKRTTPEASFVILGATHDTHERYAERLRSRASSQGLTPGKDLLFLDPSTGVSELAQAFDVFWMTSVPRSEGIPTAIEEAMALGIPVVSTDVGSCTEIVLHGETGFVVPPYDADGFVRCTVQLTRNAALRSEMGSRARTVALERFGVEECVAAHVEAFERASHVAHANK